MDEKIQTPTPATAASPSTGVSQAVAGPSISPEPVYAQPLPVQQAPQFGVVLPKAQELAMESESLFETEKPTKPMPEPVQVRYKHAFVLGLKVMLAMGLLVGLYAVAILRQTQDVSKNYTVQSTPNITDLGAKGLSEKDNLSVNVRTLFQKDVDV
jgi:hypothetical protein